MAKWITFFATQPERRWLFRGVKSVHHDLKPRAGRGELASRVNAASIVSHEAAALSAFRQSARAILPGRHSQIEWMAIAQHYGVPTRFLDWSESFLVAAWFASLPPEKMLGIPPHGYSALPYDMAIYVSSQDLPIEPGFEGDPFKIDSVRVYRPPHISPRIGAQSSVLMLCPCH
jgi:hypothetical protein